VGVLPIMLFQVVVPTVHNRGCKRKKKSKREKKNCRHLGREGVLIFILFFSEKIKGSLQTCVTEKFSREGGCHWGWVCPWDCGGVLVWERISRTWPSVSGNSRLPFCGCLFVQVSGVMEPHQRALLVYLIASLFSFSLLPGVSSSRILTLSSNLIELSVVPNDLAGTDCSLSLCPKDNMNNFFFQDILPNSDPCFLATLVEGSSSST